MLQGAAAAVALALLLPKAAAAADPKPAAKPSLSPSDTLAYVGSVGKGQQGSIYVFRLQTEDLEVPQNVLLEPFGMAATTPNPGFLTSDSKRRVVFVANDLHQFQGKASGAVSAFAVDAATGKLKLLNQRPSMGAAPCHMTLDKQRRNLLVTNCIAGSVAVFPVATDGQLGAPTEVVQHPGTKPHTHGIVLSPDNRFAFACDMGLDRIMAYRFDSRKGKLTPAGVPLVKLKAGSGPRHMVFRPDGRFAYVVGSKDSTVTVFSYDPGKGSLQQIQTLSTVPPWFDGENKTAEIAVHPTDNYLYVSNRGHDSVVLFTIDPDEGTLTYVEDQSAGGKTPRHFSLDATGEHLTVGTQDSGKMLVYRIDAGTGRLAPSGVTTPVPSPACIELLPLQEKP